MFLVVVFSLFYSCVFTGIFMKRVKHLDMPTAKKRKVAYSTFQKWERDFDREYETITWLDCKTSVKGGTKVVKKLKCTVCTMFYSCILCKRNFSDQWISGADSVRISNICDHPSSNQHSHAMALLQKRLLRLQARV